MSTRSRLLLGVAVFLHATMLVSWRTGILNPLFFDATVTHGRRGWDFYALYQAGHNVLTGHSVYESDGAAIDMVIPDGTYTPFRYLPLPAYTVGAFLNLVSPLWAYRIWVAFVEGILLLCIALTWRAVRDVDLFARLAAMWLCYTPFYLELYMGQFSLVQGAMIYVTLLLALRGKLDLGFDLAWVGSVLWKQNTTLWVPVMVRLKRWRALALLALLLALTAGPYFAFYPGSLGAFARNFSGEAPWFQLGNLGFRQLVFDVMWSVGDVLETELAPSLYVGVQGAVAGGVLFLSLALLLLDRQPDWVLHLSLWVTGFFLLYHHVWEHHYVMLLPVLVALSMRAESPWLWIIYVVLALPTPFYLVDPRGQVAVLDAMRWTPIRPLWQDIAYHASKAIPALVLYGFLAWQVASPVLRGWRSGSFYLWPFTSSTGASP
jgi:hypothetical protein